MSTSFLAIYLNDHLAGATGGVELARRLRAANRGDARFGRPLAEICAEIEADREQLLLLMERLEVRRSAVKPAAARVAAKLGRLKLNGRLRGYSPLSRLIELESLYIGIEGKMRLWEALERAPDVDRAGPDLQRLAERARRQLASVGELHRAAAAEALADGSA